MNHLARNIIAASSMFAFMGGGMASAADELARDFASPPIEAKPHTWWHWMSGNVTEEGISGDLEALHRVGVGGVEIFTRDLHHLAALQRR